MPEWSEILVILVVAMVVFGPHRLPTMARKAGKMMAEFRAAARELRQGIERELAVEEMREVAQDVISTTKEATTGARQSLAESDRALRSSPPLARPGDTAPGTKAQNQQSVQPDSDTEQSEPSPAEPVVKTSSPTGTDHKAAEGPDQTSQSDLSS